jgi:carboxypeptidase Taq
MDAHQAYRELLERAREIETISSCASVLHWDELGSMPPGGVAHRGGQLAYLAGLEHERTSDPRVGELLAALEATCPGADADGGMAANIREIRRDHLRAARQPRALVEAIARATSLAQQAWHVARQRSDFSLFLPHLESILHLKRQQAECLRGDGSAYDALVDEYDPDTRVSDLERVFRILRTELRALLERIQGSGRRLDRSLLQRSFPVERQRIFVEAVADRLGYDFHGGRLDETAHPFSIYIGPGDCRITTRYDQHNLTEALYATIHEVGHALYDQGLDPAHHATPLGQPRSLAVHESQSRLWENRVGKSRAFWVHFMPLARQVFHETLDGVALDEMYQAVNHVEPTLVRAGADEVTYDLHIIVRCELEQAMIAGDLAPADLPGAWAQRYQEYLGVRPADDAEGCLQDGHWASGMFGYFPCYTLGNVMAGQLFESAQRAMPDLDDQVARGHFAGLRQWLRHHIHRHGRRHPTCTLLQQATGGPLDPQPFLRLLRDRYRELYRL